MPNTSRSFKLFIIGVILIFASLIPYYWGLNQLPANTVIRGAIDIGSGATKLRVAEVDLKKNKIIKILVNKQIAVPYQKALSQSKDQMFDQKIMGQGLQAIRKLKAIAVEYQAKKVVGVATASFRKAKNGEEFAKKIYAETDVPIFIVNQKMEGELGFYAVIATIPVDEKTMFVWDIGGGSLQFTTFDKEGNLRVYRGHEASVPFRNYVIQNIQGRNIMVNQSPNPLTAQEIDQAENHARHVASKVDQYFKDKLNDPETKVYGIGSIFSLGIEPLVKKQTFTVKDLNKAIKSLEGKTDKELGGGSFVDVEVTNALLVKGFMKELNIRKIRIVDVNNADGAFFIKQFWSETKGE